MARRRREPERCATCSKAPPGSLLVKTPHKLDRIAEVISFREDLDNIRTGLEEIGLEPAILEKLMDEVRAGTFDKFTGAGHISSKACRNIIPGLAQGLVYSAACENAAMTTPPAASATLSMSASAARRRCKNPLRRKSSTARWSAAPLRARR